MITFLNDKDDAHIRNSFYENIVGVAAYVGWQSSVILIPLLQQVGWLVGWLKSFFFLSFIKIIFQGLWDCEEFIIPTCINAMSSLVELGLLKKHDTFDLLKDTCPYLLHPNLWIRQAAVGESSTPLLFTFIF